MENVVFTQLSIKELRQLIQDELHAFFRDKRNINAFAQVISRMSDSKDNTPIEELHMSVTLYNGLIRRNIKTLGEMKALDWKTFKRIKGVGIKSWDEMNDIINRI